MPLPPISPSAQRWDWATANPNVIFRNNDSAFGTSGLGAGQQETDDAGRAERRLVAAIYLFDLTNDATYRDYVDAHYTEAPMFASWWLSPFNAGVTRPLLYYASLPGAPARTAAEIRTRNVDLWARADYGGWGAVSTRRDPYGAFITDYTWGSNAVKALAGGMFADEALYGLGTHSAAEATNAGAAYLHYLHGINPLGKSICRTWVASAPKTLSISSSTRGSWMAARSGTASSNRATGRRPAFSSVVPIRPTGGTTAAPASRRCAARLHQGRRTTSLHRRPISTSTPAGR